MFSLFQDKLLDLGREDVINGRIYMSNRSRLISPIWTPDVWLFSGRESSWTWAARIWLTAVYMSRSRLIFPIWTPNVCSFSGREQVVVIFRDHFLWRFLAAKIIRRDLLGPAFSATRLLSLLPFWGLFTDIAFFNWICPFQEKEMSGSVPRPGAEISLGLVGFNGENLINGCGAKCPRKNIGWQNNRFWSRG